MTGIGEPLIVLNDREPVPKRDGFASGVWQSLAFAPMFLVGRVSPDVTKATPARLAIDFAVFAAAWCLSSWIIHRWAVRYYGRAAV